MPASVPKAEATPPVDGGEATQPEVLRPVASPPNVPEAKGPASRPVPELGNPPLLQLLYAGHTSLTLAVTVRIFESSDWSAEACRTRSTVIAAWAISPRM